MNISKYNEEAKLSPDLITISDKPTDARILVISNRGNVVEMFKSNLIIEISNTEAKLNKDYRKSNISSEPVIILKGNIATKEVSEENHSEVLFASSISELELLYENIKNMCCINGALLWREQFTGITTTFESGYPLPINGDKVHIYKNGQKLIEGNENGYDYSGDIVTPKFAEASDIFVLIIFS